MSDCEYCPVEKQCAYEYKPCDCVNQRKFKAIVLESVNPDNFWQTDISNLGGITREDLPESIPINGKFIPTDQMDKIAKYLKEIRDIRIYHANEGNLEHKALVLKEVAIIDDLLTQVT